MMLTKPVSCNTLICLDTAGLLILKLSASALIDIFFADSSIKISRRLVSAIAWKGSVFSRAMSVVVQNLFKTTRNAFFPTVFHKDACNDVFPSRKPFVFQYHPGAIAVGS